MITTLQEADLAAWYAIPEPVAEVSAAVDFEVEDEIGGHPHQDVSPVYSEIP
ncbi:MAG: hypothetical protein JO217_11135 [Acidobacteriaceae bacterium]|nr:hypothetical protein [Acidobacteriaceae bacterium]MBV9443239.1 hypothetical protein [Acidobacteriaceae bacterium]